MDPTQFLSERPELTRILVAHGSRSLADYARDHFKPDHGASQQAARTIRQVAQKTLDPSIADILERQLLTCSTIQTADHHQPLFDAVLFQGDALAAWGAFEAGLEILPVLAFAGIPLDNETYPRGFQWKGQRIPCFPNRMRRAVVWGLQRAPMAGSLHRLPKTLQALIVKANLDRAEDYASEISLLNQACWSKAFAPIKGFPAIAYIPAEAAVEGLLRSALHAQSALATMLLTPALCEDAIARFAGIPGAWTTDRTHGTHFFWGRNEQGRRVALWHNKGHLEGAGIRVALDPDTIVEGLSTKKIFPGLLLAFVTLLSHGLSCLGGHRQVEYLPRIRNAWRDHTHGSRNSTRCGSQHARTDGFITGPIFATVGERPASMDDFLECETMCTGLRTTLRSTSLAMASLKALSLTRRKESTTQSTSALDQGSP